MSEKLAFSLAMIIQEKHKKEIFCVKFCSILPSFVSYFASVGHNCATIYKIAETGSVETVQNYVDNDCAESLYTCTWAHSGKVAGVRGILKVINTISFELEAALRGHGHDVDDLTVHPVDLNLVLSASKDESIRMWNIKNSVCIAIFGGERAHRDDVLSIDVHPLGTCFVSGGMDTSIKVWNLASPHIQRAVADSYEDPTLTRIPFNTLFEQIPLFSTTQVHKDYVDAVAWVGNLILSKSTNNRVALWAPDPDRYPGATCVLREFRLTDCKIWYVRLGVSIPLDLLAVGNQKGKVSIYRLSPDDAEMQRLTDGVCESGGAEGDSDNDTRSSVQEESVEATGDGSRMGLASERQELLTDQAESFKDERYECGVEILPAATLFHDAAVGLIVRHICFSPDCRHLVYCCSGGKIFLWHIDIENSTSPSNSSVGRVSGTITTGITPQGPVTSASLNRGGSR